MTELAHEPARVAAGTVPPSPGYCHQPPPELRRNLLTGGDKHHHWVPLHPAFSRSPFHAPRLSKSLELMPDKGKTIKKTKKAKEQGESLSTTLSAWGCRRF